MVAMAGEVGTGRDLLVPPSIQALMAARLDLLDVAEREVVERAAVIGREFSVAGLRHLLQIEPDDAAEALEVLWRKQFVDTVSSGTFRFRHQLIADAAYESIAKRARAELHERLAEGLEAAADASLETTGYHYEQAARYLEELEPGSPAAQRVGERARDRLAAAGRRALARDDVPATVSLFTRATTLPCGPDAEDLIALARSLADAGELSRSGEVLRRAEDLAASSGRPEVSAQAAVIRVELASASSERLSVEAGLATVGRAMSVLERAGTDRAVADAWYVVSSLHQLAGNTDRSAAALEQAIEWGRRGDHQRVLASAQVQLMAMAWYGPMPARQAIRRCEEVLGGASVSPRVEAAAHRALAGLRALGGSFDEARSHLDRDRSVVLDWGLRLSVAINLMQRGYVELLADDPQAAEASCREGIDLLTGTGEREHLVGLQLLFADALFLLGRLEEALQLSLVAEEGCLSDDVVEQAHWRRVRARALAARGEQVEAERLAREAVALVGATDFLNIRGHGLLDLAHVLSYRGGFADALRALTEAEELFVRKGNLVCLERVAALRSRVLDVPVSAWA
jgi:tetratricopeptide (TPR) repeat protein